jgi:hypothetical protein
MVTTMPKNKIYMKSTRKMYTKRIHLFAFVGEVGEVGILLFMCYQPVHNDVPQVCNMFPKHLTYPISFAQSSPLLTNIDEPKGRYFIFT